MVDLTELTYLSTDMKFSITTLTLLTLSTLTTVTLAAPISSLELDFLESRADCGFVWNGTPKKVCDAQGCRGGGATCTKKGGRCVGAGMTGIAGCQYCKCDEY
jgi:hypothetical protein